MTTNRRRYKRNDTKAHHQGQKEKKPTDRDEAGLLVFDETRRPCRGVRRPRQLILALFRFSIFVFTSSVVVS
jgi:hypothetical protein